MSDAPDFQSLLATQMDDFKAPVPLPAGTYYGIVTRHEVDQSKERKTPFVRLTVNLTEAGEDIDASELEGIELGKKILRRDFYLTNDSTYIFKEFAESCDIPTAGRSLREIIPEVLNQAVQVDIVSVLNRQDPSKPPRNEIRNITGRK